MGSAEISSAHKNESLGKHQCACSNLMIINFICFSLLLLISWLLKGEAGEVLIFRETLLYLWELSKGLKAGISPLMEEFCSHSCCVQLLFVSQQ